MPVDRAGKRPQRHTFADVEPFRSGAALDRFDQCSWRVVCRYVDFDNVHAGDRYWSTSTERTLTISALDDQADNGAVEISPNPDPQLTGPVHQLMLVVNGIHLLENLRLDELAAGRAYEFAFILEPLKIRGGTGSTVAPIAIR